LQKKKKNHNKMNQASISTKKIPSQEEQLTVLDSQLQKLDNRILKLEEDTARMQKGISALLFENALKQKMREGSKTTSLA